VLDLAKAETLLARLPIRQKETGTPVPFKLNPLQQRSFNLIADWIKKGNLFRVIWLKSRRIGISALIDAIAYCHGLERPNTEGLIVAHQQRSSKAIFRVPTDLHNAMRQRIEMPEATEHRITIPHRKGKSTLAIATAGSVEAGRGMTLSFTHLSEAAFFKLGAVPFTAMLSAVSDSPETIIGVESTANGMEGPGEIFYDFWGDSVMGQTDYLPIFLSWIEDLSCRRDPTEAADAPQGEYERDLMTGVKAQNGDIIKCDKSQIAWMRYILYNKCQGRMEKFQAEYPWCPEVAFVATGNPAFTMDEVSLARETVMPPIAVGNFESSVDDHTRRAADVRFVKSARGQFLLWELPMKGCRYYIGGDAAKGEDNREGDFASLVGWNGTTGDQAFRFADRITPEALADAADMTGRWYNMAMVNIEITGGWGATTQNFLRDRYHYPNIYRWRGHRDDAVQRKARTAYGFTTSYDSKRMMFGHYKEGLRARTLKPKDAGLVQQMSRSSWSDYGRWDPIRGHDDVMIAALLARIAWAQYPPPPSEVMAVVHTLPVEDEDQQVIAYQEESSGVLRRRWHQLTRAISPKVDRLEGL
jgi:hypothetical protein